MAYNILILGAAYGSLLASKMLFGGHKIHHICLPAEADLINAEGFRVRLPVKGRKDPVLLDSTKLPGKVTAGPATGINPKDYDLVGLAMQEPQYRSPGVRELLDAVAKSRVPCMSIMNMPPDEGVNVLQITLPTNFKAARFASDTHTAILRRMQADIEAVRYGAGDDKVDLPVKLKVHDSLFVPLAKWAMLLTGNYRCVQKDAARSIREAVHTDIAASRAVYNWVSELCIKLGAAPADLVPFEKYAAAAQGLVRPSSAARALFAGAPNIERVDRLVQAIDAQKGMRLAAVDESVALVDARLDANRKQVA